MLRILASLLIMASFFVAAPIVRADSSTTGTITGTVTGGSGNTISIKLFKPHPKGARPTAAGGKGRHHEPPVAQTSADANGNFTLPNVAPGTYVIVAVSKGVGAGHATVTVTAGQTATVSLTLTKHVHKKKVASTEASCSGDSVAQAAAFGLQFFMA